MKLLFPIMGCLPDPRDRALRHGFLHPQPAGIEEDRPSLAQRLAVAGFGAMVRLYC